MKIRIEDIKDSKQRRAMLEAFARAGKPQLQPRKRDLEKDASYGPPLNPKEEANKAAIASLFRMGMLPPDDHEDNVILDLVLPYPPLNNRYYRHGRGRTYLSPEGATFKEEVARICQWSGVKPASGPVALFCASYRPQKSGDASAVLKALEDALEGYAYENDKQIEDVQVQRRDDKDNPRLEVRVWKLPTQPAPKKSTNVDKSK